jgi:CheY-like chemotaxis protein
MLWLPVTDEVAVVREPLRDLPAMASGHDRTVLLVDDEELVRIATAEMLIEAGSRVVQADSAFAAIDLLGNGLHIDALITDHAMPGVTGAALARRLKHRHPDLPVLMITGYANLSDAGSIARLAKPLLRMSSPAFSLRCFRNPGRIASPKARLNQRSIDKRAFSPSACESVPFPAAALQLGNLLSALS